MTNYISSINGLSLLQDCGKNDSLFLVVHEDDLKNLSLEGFELLLHLKTVMAQFELRKYTVLAERDLAIADPIFRDDKSDFVLVDENFPEFHYFGARVSKLSKNKAVKKTASKSKKNIKGIEDGVKISGEPTKLPAQVEKPNKPVKFELDRKDSVVTATFDNSSTAAENPDKNSVHERVQLAKNMGKLLKLNPEEYGCNMGADVFNLMIAQVFKNANNDEEIKNGILALDYGEMLWEKVSPHVEEIKNLI